MIGMSGNAERVFHTATRPIGSTAGPETPPVTWSMIGSPVRMLMRMPSSVLIMLSASAPLSAAARAGTVMSVTFGVSLTIIFLSVSLRSRVIRRLNATGSVPTLMPPADTFGQLTLISSISAGESFSLDTTSM